MIYLASKSPRRTELLSQIGANHLVIDVSVDEIINPMMNAKENAELLSVQKCQEGIKHIMVNQMDELIHLIDHDMFYPFLTFLNR